MIKYLQRTFNRSKWRWQLLAVFLLAVLLLYTGRQGTAGITHIIALPINSTKRLDVGNFSRDPPAASKHVVFIKVHKAASTTVMNMMLRFALSNNLTVMLPRKANCINEYGTVSKHDILPSTSGQYDILCNHVIYNRTAIAPFFPPDTRYVTILREPFDQFVSAFSFYRSIYPIPYLRNITSPNPIHKYLTNPSSFEPKRPITSFTNNRMSLDLGYPDVSFRNLSHVDGFVKSLDREFDLVMLVEYFDESVILLKRTLNWKMKDVLYISSNSLPRNKNRLNISAEDRLAYRKWAKVDHALYDHFYEKLWKKIFEQGKDFFQEVKAFRFLRSLMTDYCFQSRRSSAAGNLVLPSTDWNNNITVTKHDCRIMLEHELSLIEAIKRNYMLKFHRQVSRSMSSNSTKGRTLVTKLLETKLDPKKPR